MLQVYSVLIAIDVFSHTQTSPEGERNENINAAEAEWTHSLEIHQTQTGYPRVENVSAFDAAIQYFPSSWPFLLIFPLKGKFPHPTRLLSSARDVWTPSAHLLLGVSLQHFGDSGAILFHSFYMNHDGPFFPISIPICLYKSCWYNSVTVCTHRGTGCVWRRFGNTYSALTGGDFYWNRYILTDKIFQYL